MTWLAMATSDAGPNLLGYTISGADNGGQAFGICALKATNVEQFLWWRQLWETNDGGLTWHVLCIGKER